MKKIVAAGSIIVDKINAIDAYPGAGELVQIRSRSRAGGGLVHNTGRDIRLFSPDIPVAAFGMVGADEDGRFVIEELESSGVDVSGVKVSQVAGTSFTDVMSVPGGERTFFAYAGACAEWGYDDFPFDRVAEGDIVLLGYFLLLEKIDGGDGLKILKELKRRGAMTAIDLVTENSDRYSLVRECLPYVDYLVINEIEAARIVGREMSPEELCRELMELGVRERVVIHMPERGVTLTRGGEAVSRPSLDIPRGLIRGKTGAGDAYCAGVLTGIYRGAADAEILELGALAAIGALTHVGAVEGVKTENELRELVARFKNTSC